MPAILEEGKKNSKKIKTKIKMQFDPNIAKDVGVEEAIMYANIEFWVWHNQLNKKHFYDGRYWTYNSQRAFQEQFPFWSRQNIRTILKKLIAKGYIKVGTFNDHKYDRTSWFAIIKNQPSHRLESTNGYAQINQPIPDSKPDSIDINSVGEQAPVYNYKKTTTPDETNGAKQWNDAFFAAYKRITGESPKDEPEHRLKFPRLIRQKYKDIALIADILQWGWDLRSKTTGDYYWRGRLTLAKLYHRILPDFMVERQASENKAKLTAMKENILKRF